MEQYLSEATIALLTSYTLRLIGALILLFIAWIVAGWAGRLTVRGLKKAEFDETLTKFFGNMARYTVLILAVLGCLGIFGVQTTSFAAVLAAAGFAIGLAFQGTLSNFSAGIMLLVFRPFKIGDVISVAGVFGKVNAIELFTTKLDTPDNRRVIIPNSQVFGATIENMTHHDIRRIDVSVGTEYSADIDRVREVLQAAADAEPTRLPDEPTQVLLTDLGDSSINWQVRVWAKAADYFDAKDSLTRSVKVTLDKAGLGIPFPQMDVHLDKAGN